MKKICKTAAGTSELIFKNALHAPDLSSNLISINRFDKAGFNVVFGGGQVRFRDPNSREVLCGTGAGGMYLLSSPEVLDGPTVMTARSLTKPTTLDVWHRRFGHASVKKIREALAKNLVDGLDIRGNLTVAGLCKDCVYGKHAARPYDATVIPEGLPNDRVHINLWGPSSVQSMGGAIYMMVTVDGGTSYVSVYFLTRKDADTTLTAFTAYHVESERQTGQKLREARVDAGQEWINESWATYLGKHSIILKVTTPYAHVQNGLVKHMNRTILEGVRCVLAESGLSKELWAEAAAALVYTRNLLPTSQHPETIPKEAWTSRRQHVDHLRSWGCLVWAKIPEELIRSKLDPRSVKTCLVGYANSGYRLYDQGTRLIITSRDVIFEEGTGHRSLTILDDYKETAPMPAHHASGPAQGVITMCQPNAPRI